MKWKLGNILGLYWGYSILFGDTMVTREYIGVLGAGKPTPHLGAITAAKSSPLCWPQAEAGLLLRNLN